MLLKILLSSKGKNILNINKLNVFVSVKMIPMNFLKQLTRITDYVNQFIKNVTNLGKKDYLYWTKIGCSLTL